MKTYLNILLVAVFTASVGFADTTWPELQAMIGNVFGPEWTVSKDFHSIVAVTRDARLLGTINRIDTILLKKGEDPWDKAIASDYVITITVRPKLSAKEYSELAALRAKLIATRTKGRPSDSWEAFNIRVAAEDAITLPDFYLGDRAVYVDYTAKRSFEVRPTRIVTCRDQVLDILKDKCIKYKESEQDGGGNAHEPPSHPSTARPKARATP